MPSGPSVKMFLNGFVVEPSGLGDALCSAGAAGRTGDVPAACADEPFSRRDAAARGARLVDAGGGHGQFQHLAAIQRQIGHLLLVPDLADAGIVGGNGRCAGFHCYFL